MKAPFVGSPRRTMAPATMTMMATARMAYSADVLPRRPRSAPRAPRRSGTVTGFPLALSHARRHPRLGGAGGGRGLGGDRGRARGGRGPLLRLAGRDRRAPPRGGGAGH